MTARAIRGIAVAMVATLLVSGGALTAQAYWRSTASLSTTVASGAVGIALGAPTGLSGAYATGTLTRVAPLTVTNTGSVPMTYAITVAGTGSGALATSVQVTRWSVASTSACTATPGPGALAGTWAAPPVISGTLAVGAVNIWCVRTSLTAAQLPGLSGSSIQMTFTATGTTGLWGTSASQTVTQNVAAATMSCTPSGSPWGVTVSWSPPAGWPYHYEELWVDGVFFSAQNSNYTSRYLDWSLLAAANGTTPGNPQTFTLQARAQNPSTGQWLVVAERTVVTRVIDYGNYSHNVVECS
jgi:hypothetical protein